MTREEYLIQKFETRAHAKSETKERYYSTPSVMAIEPFRIADHLYYVGDKRVCVHLIETEEGLILIDSGYPCASHLVVDSIWRAGFDPKNVRWILHSHGHFDHFGVSDDFRILYGTKLAISAVDAQSLRDYPHRAHLDLGSKPYLKTPIFDRELQDGEIFRLGSTEIRCVLTPGHTAGVMSFFFNVTDGGKTYLAGTFGGAGTNALLLDQMTYNRDPLDRPQEMLRSIDRVIDEPVMIHLGNHPANNNTVGRREQQLREGGNPFIDGNSWRKFLTGLQETVRRIIADNEALERELDERFGPA